MSFFVSGNKHIFVAISFVCVMILLYCLVYKPSMLSQRSKQSKQIITTLGGGCGKQLNSKQVRGKQSAHAYSDSDYE